MKYPVYDLNGIKVDFNKPKIMGILNTTPDSFSDGGKYFNTDKAIEHALQMLEDGADIIDIGGESTRPGSEPVNVDEEINRTIPVVEKLKNFKNDIVISIDTTKSDVAEEAMKSGSSIINDISGLTFDENMISVAKKFNAAVVIMHIKGNPKTMQDNPYYNDVVKEVKDFLAVQSQNAKKSGVEKIIIDPGIGFGKRIDDNFTLIKNLNEFESLGFPIMIGLSRKSFIGKTLELDIAERDIPTVVLEGISVIKSARIIRTHNVKYCAQMVKLVNKIIQN
jgi:dihydropteroate synthase